MSSGSLLPNVLSLLMWGARSRSGDVLCVQIINQLNILLADRKWGTYSQGVKPLVDFAHVEPDKAYREPEKVDDAHLVTAEQRCTCARRA
jgi:hypothetical protein